MNVFIIATDHNLIQVREAIKYYNLEISDSSLIFMHFQGESPSISLIPEGLSYDCFSIWSIKDLHKNRKVYYSYLSFLNELKRSHNSFTVFSNFYTSDFVLIAISVLNPTKVVIMDEGTASFGVVLKRRKKQKRFFECAIKSLLYFRRIRIPRHICFFSQYQLNISETDTLDIYSFKREKNNISINPNYAIVLGQPLCEANLIGTDSYWELLVRLNEIVTQAGISHIEYYAHRRESNEKLLRLKMLGWGVHSNSGPFEDVFPTLDPSPSRVYGFYSPILDTLSKKYENIPDFYIIEITKEQYDSFRNPVVPEIYSIYKKNPRLKVISI